MIEWPSNHLDLSEEQTTVTPKLIRVVSALILARFLSCLFKTMSTRRCKILLNGFWLDWRPTSHLKPHHSPCSHLTFICHHQARPLLSPYNVHVDVTWSLFTSKDTGLLVNIARKLLMTPKALYALYGFECARIHSKSIAKFSTNLQQRRIKIEMSQS